METNALLHDITLLERKLHGIITQRERLGVNTKETEETEGELKKSLAEKKQKLRAIMEDGEPPMKPPRQPAFIKNGVTLEMLEQIIEMEDKLCAILPVIETKPIEPAIQASLTGPVVVNNTADDVHGHSNFVIHPPSSSSPSSPPSSSTSSSAASAQFAACSLSTYPHLPEGAGAGRQGDPLCDRFSINVHSGDSAVVALADGCNWGRLPFEAANRATNAFVQYLEDRITTVKSLRGAGSLLLAALSAANKKITEGLDKWECGTTTLIGGLLVPVLSSHAPPIGSLPRSNSWSSSNSLPVMLNVSGRMRAGSTTYPPNINKTAATSPSTTTPSTTTTSTTTNNNSNNANNNNNTAVSSHGASSSSSKWVFVCVSLGDCKAFHYSQRTRQFTDITEGNRQNLTDARDPGGRLGPYIEADPDLRNLHLYYHLTEPGDIILLMSDGVHDNLDPQQLGISPPETKSVVAETWEEAEKLDPTKVEAFKNNFRKKWLEDTFSKHLVHPQPDKALLEVKTVVNVLLQHCVSITKTSREFMEQNPKLKLPSDFKTYPGKLDHATCVCLSVGTSPSS